jgi:hypothetical protein
MNKLSLFFTALRVYRQARGQETTTLRGVIAGTLAAGAITGLWWMGAELTADQISLVMGAVYGVDTILKIVMPDRLGETHDDETVSALPQIELQGRADAGDAGVDAGAVRAVDGLRQPVPPVDYPIGGADDTYPNLPPAGFGDRG